MNKPEEFWARVDVRGFNECWEWQGCRHPIDGRGRLRWRGEETYAHRLAFELATGRKLVNHGLHTCDNPPCCNPSHVRDGTQADNMIDMQTKGRARGGTRAYRGEEHHNSYLGELKVRQIRDLCRFGFTQRLVAVAFHTTQATVQRIASRKVWRHVE